MGSGLQMVSLEAHKSKGLSDVRNKVSPAPFGRDLDKDLTHYGCIVEAHHAERGQVRIAS